VILRARRTHVAVAVPATYGMVTGPVTVSHVWNVHEATLAGRERTSNHVCEGWNHAFRSLTWLVTIHHPSLWIVLGALQQVQALVATALLQDAHDQPPTTRC